MIDDARPRFTREAALGEIIAELREMRERPPELSDATDVENLEIIEEILLKLADGPQRLVELGVTRE